MFAAVATPMVGAAGAVGAGVTASGGADCAPVPAVVIAATVNVYGVPLVSPSIVYVRTLPTVTGAPLEGVMT